MVHSLLNDEEITDIYNKYVDMIYRICFMYLKNDEDSKDVVQSVFVKLCKHSKGFNDDNHIKSWLILCATNMCKNKLKYWFSKVVDMTSIKESGSCDKSEDLLSLILKLPTKYKTSLYLHYYEGYKTNEISQIINVSDSTVRSYLHRGRIMLEQLIEEEDYEKKV